ncbi:hypothetical protein FR943_21790 [Mycobacterium sp. TNTM28]|uniref:Uncharacterized protein n=1 Tax=[Mycobacterium] fortunisiensis TaxID=2600579 RepID=A0ABS6KSH4_9MYCO|nr:hypothetical protein [[Mycobacterium] fortunisiensis]MBU9766464.1 hypothetical protein [[Mycobacterium] fortunisiensis]
MTTPNPSTRRVQWWRSALTARLALAGAFVALLLGAVDLGANGVGAGWSGAAASFAGFLTAITVIAAVATSWEHLVVNARSAGLVAADDPSVTR